MGGAGAANHGAAHVRHVSAGVGGGALRRLGGGAGHAGVGVCTRGGGTPRQCDSSRREGREGGKGVNVGWGRAGMGGRRV